MLKLLGSEKRLVCYPVVIYRRLLLEAVDCRMEAPAISDRSTLRYVVSRTSYALTVHYYYLTPYIDKSRVRLPNVA